MKTMSMINRVVLGCVAGTLVWGQPAWAQVGSQAKADPRVRQALKAADLKFLEMPSGDFTLHFTFLNQRTHLAVVQSRTTQLGGLEVRDVWAVGYRSKELPSATVLARLLQDSTTKKVGAWELHVPKEGGKDQGYTAIFNVKVAADCDPQDLSTILWAVVKTADAMEEELTSQDEF